MSSKFFARQGSESEGSESENDDRAPEKATSAKKSLVEYDDEGDEGEKRTVAKADEKSFETLNNLSEKVQKAVRGEVTGKKTTKHSNADIDLITSLSNALDELQSAYTNIIKQAPKIGPTELRALKLFSGKVYSSIAEASKKVTVNNNFAKKLRLKLDSLNKLKAEANAYEKNPNLLEVPQPNREDDQKSKKSKLLDEDFEEKEEMKDDKDDKEESDEEIKQTKKQNKAKSKWFQEDSDKEESEEEKPAKSASAQKKSKWFAEESDEDEIIDKEEEKPKAAAKTQSKKGKWFAEESDEDEEEKEKVKVKVKPVEQPKKAKNKWFAGDSDDDQEEKVEVKPVEQPKKGKNKWFAGDSDDVQEEKVEVKPVEQPKKGKNKWFDEDSDKEEDKKQDKTEKGEKITKKVQPEVVATPTVERQQTKELAEMNYEEIDEFLNLLIANRGKKGTDPSRQLREITKIIPFCRDDIQRIRVLLACIEANFDLGSRTQHKCMPKDNWTNCMNYLQEVLNIATTKSDEIALIEGEDEQILSSVSVTKAAVRNRALRTLTPTTPMLSQSTEIGEGDSVTKTISPDSISANELLLSNASFPIPASSAGLEVLDNKTLIPASPFSLLLQLSDDLTTTQRLPHKVDEFDHTANKKLLEIALLVQNYYLDKSKNASRKKQKELLHKAALMSCLRIERISCVYEEIQGEITQQMKQLVQFALANLKPEEKRSRVRVMLCSVYFSALHDDYFGARNDFLGSHIQSTIENADPATHVLYFRALTQLALAAFRCGHFTESHGCLSEVCEGGGALRAHYDRILRESQAERGERADINTRMKAIKLGARELLGQGMVHIPSGEIISTKDQNAELTRQVPQYMHIDLALVNETFMLSNMLLEVPIIAAMKSEIRTRPSILKAEDKQEFFRQQQQQANISRQIRSLMNYNEHQSFYPEPKNSHDYISLACRCMLAGDWKGCLDAVKHLTLWTILPQKSKAQKLEELTTERIKVETLRCFLFLNAPYYSTLSITKLANRFDLSEDKIKTIVYKMIIVDEFLVLIDHPNNTIVPTITSIVPRDSASMKKKLHNLLPSKIQLLALENAEKLCQLHDLTKKIVEKQYDVKFAEPRFYPKQKKE